MANVQANEKTASEKRRENEDPEREQIIKEIEEKVTELSRASPSGAESITADIHDSIARLRMSPEERALKMPHPNAGRDPRAAGRNPPGPLTPPGVAFPVGVDVKDRSADDSRDPVPVAPASPDDIRAWQDGQMPPGGRKDDPAAGYVGNVKPAYSPEDEKKRLEDEAAELKRVQAQRQQNASDAPAENQKQAELDQAEAERKRVLANELASPRQAQNPDPAPGIAKQAETDRLEAERRNRVVGGVNPAPVPPKVT
jgi:hypothetical protein